jgi:hypothetical protein
MEFLKEILGESLYTQLEQALNAYNGNEANKDKQVKLANLSSGEYVGKGKYDGLQAQLESKDAELTAANDLITELKKGTKGDDGLQTKITEYQTLTATLQKELEKTKVENAIQLALRDAKALDPDYLAYKLHEQYKPEELTLDESGKIKGIEDKLSGLKTQFPAQFEKAGSKKVVVNELNEGKDGEDEPKNLADALQMAYEAKNE